MQFSDIFLSRKELALLKALASSDIQLEHRISKEFERLESLDFAESDFLISDGTITIGGNRISITDTGRGYLSFLRGRKASMRAKLVRDAFLLILGAVITLFFEHIHEVIALCGKLFQ